MGRSNTGNRRFSPHAQKIGSNGKIQFSEHAQRIPFVLYKSNLVPRAHESFGQRQDTELWNNQSPESKILGVPVSRRMRALVYMASREKVDVGAFHKGIQYALEKLGKLKFGLERTAV